VKEKEAETRMRGTRERRPDEEEGVR